MQSLVTKLWQTDGIAERAKTGLVGENTEPEGAAKTLVELEGTRHKSAACLASTKALASVKEELANLQLPPDWKSATHPEIGETYYTNEKTKAVSWSHPCSTPATVCTDAVPRFAEDDPAALEYLSAHGYVVMRNVLNENEVSTAHELLWDFLSSTLGWQRGKMETWDEKLFRFVGLPHWGIVKAAGAGQSEFVWYARTRPRIRQIFARIWGTSQLLTSFDGFNMFLPWHHGFQKTDTGWLHCDQGDRKQGLVTVQSFVALTAQNANTGGLLVIPGSHHAHESWVNETSPGAENDFVQVVGSNPLLQLPRQLVVCEPGDLVLWDSRCVHCNTPAMLQPTSPEGELLRVAAYVCMVPKARASQECLRAREAAYMAGMSCNHWPLLSQEELPMFDNNFNGFRVKHLDETDDARGELLW